MALVTSVDTHHMLDTPAELCCPLTRQLLHQPVLTTAGHVYEKKAILEHLKLHDTDPISGEPISASRLTDVQYLLKRVESYRGAAISGCIETACSEDCQEPVKYLRRALELCAGRGHAAPGLTAEFAAYVHTHQSNVYDVYALQIFAKELQSDGYPHLAAKVVTKLLHMGEDKAQQVAIVKQWLSLHAQTAASDGCEAAQLSSFIRSHRLLTWSQSLDIMSEAGVSLQLVAKTCKHLLADSTSGCDNLGHHTLFMSYADMSLQCASQRLQELQDLVPNLQLEPLALLGSSSCSGAGLAPSARQSRHTGACKTRWLPLVAFGLTLEAVASPAGTLLVLSHAAVAMALARCP